MKKFAIATTMALAALSAQAANYVSVTQESVQSRSGGADSSVSYLRGGKDFGNYSLNLQSRVARFDTGTTSSSMEATLSNKNVSMFGITPFIGAARNISSNYTYGLVGLTAGAKIGPGFAMAGVKTRVGSTETVDTKQTVTFASYSVPVAKDISVSLGANRSSQDIKEKGVSVGVSFGF